MNAQQGAAAVIPDLGRTPRIHILGLVRLEELSRGRVFQFAFVCLPLRIKGATGSMVRSVAIV